jgi:hypothetical protein
MLIERIRDIVIILQYLDSYRISYRHCWICIGLVIPIIWIWIELIISNIRLVEPIGLQYFCLNSEKEMEK